MAAEKPRYIIMRRREQLAMPKLGEVKTNLAISYTAEGMAPGTIFISKNEWTEDLEEKKILEDIARRKTEQA